MESREAYGRTPRAPYGNRERDPVSTPASEPPTSRYPEHDKLHEIKDKSQACGEFLEWLRGRYWIGTLDANSHAEAQAPGPEPLLAEFFGIDPTKLEAEKRAMLDEFRASNRAGAP